MIYQPREDSLLLTNQVKKYATNKSVLDIGTGTGIQAKVAQKAGAIEVIASDIDIEVIKDLKEKGIKVIQSDLFSNINGKFDLIIFNPPYLPHNNMEDSNSKRATTGGEKGDEIILRFFSSLNKYLTEDGISLIVLSSLTPKIRILNELKKQKLNYEVQCSQIFFFETLEVWEIKKEK